MHELKHLCPVDCRKLPCRRRWYALGKDDVEVTRALKGGKEIVSSLDRPERRIQS